MIEHAPHNVLTDPHEIARFHDRCSDLMRELLDGLAAVPGEPRPFPEIEDAIGWPRRRIASEEELKERGGGAMMTLTSLPLVWDVTS